jgi:hypothetical protein
MAEQEEKNISNFIKNSLKSIKKLYKREYINLNLDLENENFTNNFEEIIKNPSSNYCDEIHLFSKIPNLKLQKDELKIATESLKDLKENLEKQIYGDKEINEEKLKTFLENLKNNKLDKNAEDKIIEEIGLKNYQQFLKKEINGDDKAEKDSFEEMGLEAYKEKLKKEIYGDVTDEEALKILKEWIKKKYNNKKVHNESESEIIEEVGLEQYGEFLDIIVRELRKNYVIAKDLSTLIIESTKDKKMYYLFMILVIGALGFSSWYAYEYGAQIIVEIHGMKERTSSDYFGFFLMKMPFSLIIIAFISGAFIFINKLLFIIERINNQLRNFSKISVIASQMDNTYIDLIKNSNFSNGNEAEQNAHKEAEQKNLFYKLITNYLVSLSKNEADLADSKKEPLLKQVKQIAGIVKELNSFNKDK